MNPNKCKKCGQFANTKHKCDTASAPQMPKQLPQKIDPKAIRPQELITGRLMKDHERVACIRLMSSALGNPTESGRGHYAQAQARIVLEQRFGTIDWSK